MAASLSYHTLVLATGARHAYFGHDDWEPCASGLKTLEDATTIRRRILPAFEKAERESDAERQAALLTFVIIGAGPTGVELAGTIAELARYTLRRDFRNIDTRRARVVLIEAGPRVLAGFAEDLSAYAQRSLEGLGAEVELGPAVSDCTADGVVYGERGCRRNRHLGRRRAGLAGRRLPRRAGRPRGPPEGRAESHCSRTSRNLCHWRRGDDRRPDGNLVPGIAPAAKQRAPMSPGDPGSVARRSVIAPSATSTTAALRRSANGGP